MSQPPSCPSPAERFATILFHLQQVLAAQTGWGISNQLIALISGRLLIIKQGFARLAARIAAGTYRPRRPAARPRTDSAGRKPRRKSPLPSRAGWLLKLLQQTAAGRAQLETLFADPEMLALISTAPAAMRRPLRSLCHMLAIEPPPVLALPPKPRRPRPVRPPKPPRRLLPAEKPAWMNVGPDRNPTWTLHRICGRRGPR